LSQVQFGWKSQQVIGKKFSEVILPLQYRKGYEQTIKYYLKTGIGNTLNKQIELTAINSSGHELVIEMSMIPVQQGDTNFICSFIRDISENKKNKLELERLSMVHKAEKKGLSLTNEFCDNNLSPVLIGDPYRINQILLNLISNSLKFTEKGTVDISCKVIEDTPATQTVRITVKDTGIGMD
jgi:PAS domain S-box-containing protein